MSVFCNRELLTLFLLCVLTGSISAQSQKNESRIDLNDLRSRLTKTQPNSPSFDDRQNVHRITLPLPGGQNAEFEVFEAPVLAPELGPKYPEIRSFTGRSVQDPTCLIRLNLNFGELYAIISDRNGLTRIEPSDRKTPQGNYKSHRLEKSQQITCDGGILPSGEVDLRSAPPTDIIANSCFQVGSELRIYRLAMAVTPGFADLNRDINDNITLASVNAAIANRLADLNLVYEREAAIRLVLIGDNDDLITPIVNNTENPFPNPTSTTASIDDGAIYINSKIDVADFDIGHSMHETNAFSAAGRAQLYSVCDNDTGADGIDKARGYSILFNFSSSVSLMLHEFGHQFSCRHTNYGCSTGGNCERYEPGQGSTIMSTSAGCDENIDEFQSSRDDYFHVESLASINRFIGSGMTTGSSCQSISTDGNLCGTTMSTGNTPPTANANPSNTTYNIPKGTPFMLTGFAIDPDQQDVLTYSWEQIDKNNGGSASPENAADDPLAPLFRTFPPVSSPTRIFPAMANILAGNVPNNTGEALSNVARTMNFSFLVRDNCPGGGGSACDAVSVNVTGDGPFALTSQNSSATLSGGTDITVSWLVAGTDQGVIDCANVDIRLSLDCGETFSTVLIANTPNDGEQTVTLPNINSDGVRIQVKCSDNIFFDVNDADLTITTSNNCLAGRSLVGPGTAMQVNVGDPALDLGLSAAFTSGKGTISLSYDASSPFIRSLRRDLSGDCELRGFFSDYDFAVFMVDKGGTYTLSAEGAQIFRIISVFQESNFSVLNGCPSLVETNASETPGNPASTTISFSFDVQLEAGVQYRVATYGRDSDAYNLRVDGPGTVYLSTTGPGSDYAYIYAAVDEASGVVKMLSPTADFQTLSVGKYCIYGISYKSAAGSPPAVDANNFAGRTLQDIVSNDGCVIVSINKKQLVIDCPNAKRFEITVNLQGAYNSVASNLDDQLRTLSNFPVIEPYTALGYTVNENASACLNPLLLTAVSPSAESMIDYIYVELRSDLTTFVTSKVGLLRKNGSIANLDGTPFTICVNSGDYYVVLKHRNHLGTMSAEAINVP